MGVKTSRGCRQLRRFKSKLRPSSFRKISLLAPNSPRLLSPRRFTASSYPNQSRAKRSSIVLPQPSQCPRKSKMGRSPLLFYRPWRTSRSWKLSWIRHMRRKLAQVACTLDHWTRPFKIRSTWWRRRRNDACQLMAYNQTDQRDWQRRRYC